MATLRCGKDMSREFYIFCRKYLDMIVSKYPQIKYKTYDAMCGEGYGSHNNIVVAATLTPKMSLYLDDHPVKNAEFTMSLVLNGITYTNRKKGNCFETEIKYYERVIMSSADIINLCLSPHLQATYSVPGENVKILDENNFQISKLSGKIPEIIINRGINIPKTILVNTSQKSYKDMVLG